MSGIPRVNQKLEYLEQIRPLLKITNTDQKQMTTPTPCQILSTTPKRCSSELKDSKWLPSHNARVQAKAMGHQVSPLTEFATSAVDVRPTFVYRLSWPGYFTMEPVVPGTSTWPTSVEELTWIKQENVSMRNKRQTMLLQSNGQFE